MRQRASIRRTGLARALSKLGYCSRSQARELIRSGRVSLNGRVRRDPETPVNLGAERIAVDGKSVSAERKVYLILNKPRGVVTTASDEKGRKTVYAFLDSELPFVAPVGRLDKASEGLLLLTNDSEWGARIVAPATHLDKTYHVQIGKVADAELVRRLVTGVEAEGERLRAKCVRILRGGERNTWLEVVLDEGKNRQIRRMFEEVGHHVEKIKRIRYGPLTLDVEPGQFRHLASNEVQALRKPASPSRRPAQGEKRPQKKRRTRTSG
jgi:23S rRNA pseudouridine2605 synthase